MGAKRKNHTTQNQHRANNYTKISDICQIRADAVSLGLPLTTKRWNPRYETSWIEDVIFYRIHKSILEDSAQAEADSE